jgi:cytochrome c553
MIRAASLLLLLLVCNLVLAKTDQPNQRAKGLAAWKQVESVLTHPRCLNCHTATQYPRQGDDRHKHHFNVVRGPADKGATAAPCASCHGPANNASSGVPGKSGWHLAPLSMAWERAPGQAMNSAELCRTFKSQARNGNRTPDQLVEHHATEPLVLWAWQPGTRVDGTPRASPPLSHEGFVSQTKRWAEAGAPCP